MFRYPWSLPHSVSLSWAKEDNNPYKNSQDFDVLKGEITFTVFRCKSDPSSPDTEDVEMPGKQAQLERK